MSEKIEPEHTFGKKSQLGDVWNAGRCINGDKTTVKKNHYNQIQIKEEILFSEIKIITINKYNHVYGIWV